MTDQTDRPDGGPEQRLPATRPSIEPVATRPVERFTAPRQVRNIHGLTSERAAKIVRQTGDARWVAFLGLVIVALFVTVYYFYERGLPFNLSTPRLAVEEHNQQVTSVERGYNLYEANCARCHGANGQGDIGPVLNDQSKLFSHLSEAYLKNVLTVGGRYVCGNPKSVMPVWADTNGGPLNYLQIADIIAFIRAPSTQEYQRRDPELNEPILGADGKVLTFKGWRDTTWKPEPSATPVPDCYRGDTGSATAAPQPTLGPDATIIPLSAEGVAFSATTLEAPAGKLFGIDFTQKDSGVGGHNVEIKDAGGASLFKGEILNDPGEVTYAVGPLAVGSYTFVCSVHSNMSGTLTVK